MFHVLRLPGQSGMQEPSIPLYGSTKLSNGIYPPGQLTYPQHFVNIGLSYPP